jgi:peptide/nickel transport system permease protein
MKEFFLYAFRRLLMLIPFFLGLTVMAFLLGVWAPGDPALAVLTMDGSSDPGPAELEAMRHTMGLDRPLWEQYGQWMIHALQGNLGISYLTQKPVAEELLIRFPVTLSLAVCALLWVCLLGIPGGLWAARCKDRMPDTIIRIGALLCISVPGFWLAILGMLLFSEEWQLLPSSGYGSAVQMILPSFVLAAAAAGSVVRLQRASMLEVLEKDFVLTEKARGLPFPVILRRHVLPNALMPVITMVGTFFGSVLGGSVIIENLFSIPGLGSYVLAAIWGRDYPAVQGYVLISGTVFVFFNYLVDLSYYWINPETRKNGGES